MATFEEQLNNLLERTHSIKSPINAATIGTDINEYNRPSEVWINDVEIFYNNYLKEHPLGNRMKTILFHRNLDAYKNLVGCLESISKDQDFINKMNGISMVSVPKYQAKTLPEFDVFISHANKDKEDLIEELYQSLNKLGIKIFYDKESLEWGDNWKDRILNGTKKAEFAIIVISENFFDREWTERELNEFLNRQNRNGQKLILPILHNITVSQLQEKYPSIADIQAIDSSKSDKLKTSAKNNTQQDFEFSYFDDIDDALIEGLSQNQDFFSMLLSNDEMKHQVMGIFSDEIYKSLRESV